MSTPNPQILHQASLQAPALHLSLNVSDLTRSVEFYSKVFGPPVKLKDDYAKFVGHSPALHLALQPAPGLQPGGSLSHLGIRVGSSAEVAAWRQQAAARGMAPLDELNTECCYDRQDKFWVADPDGNRWEVYTVLEDAPAAQQTSTASCCTPSAGQSAVSGSGCC